MFADLTFFFCVCETLLKFMESDGIRDGLERHSKKYWLSGWTCHNGMRACNNFMGELTRPCNQTTSSVSQRTVFDPICSIEHEAFFLSGT